MRIWVALLTVVVACAFAVSGFAGEPKKKDGKRQRASAEERFKQMDTNKDGKLSCEEFVAGNKRMGEERAKEAFKRWGGTEKDGLTLEQYKKGREKAREEYSKKRGEKKDKK